MTSPSNSSGNRSFEKLRALDAQFDAQLDALSGKKDRESRGRGTTFLSPARWIFWVCAVALFLVLPFILLIRISVFTYIAYDLNGWLALGTGAAATVLLLMLYGINLSARISGRARLHRYVVRTCVLLVFSYCCYGMLYLSSVNAKTEQVRSHYRSLHPILRITVATATLADTDLIITDMQRTPQDYRHMGLTARQQSLHYAQSTGYVHAVDIRTLGRPGWKNWLTEHLLRLLGYNTLRHVGTADHLHVSLPLND